MSNTESGSRAHYSTEEDKTMIKYYKKAWSMVEIAYQLYMHYGVVRTPAGINKRLITAREESGIESLPRGTRYVTTEAITWVNETFNLNCEPSKALQLREHRRKPNGKSNGVKKKAKARELIGITKGVHDPNPTYTVITARLASTDMDKLQLFQSLLEAGMAEGKTVVDIVDDLRLIGT